MTLLATSHVKIGALQLSDETDGRSIIVESLDGWGSPASTLTPQQFERSNGAWFGDSYLRERPLTMNGIVIADSHELASDLLDDLITAVSLAETKVTVTEGSTVRSVMARRGGEVIYGEPTNYGRNIPWSIQMVALDPRKTATPLTGSTGLPSSSGGWTFPVTLPAPIEASSVSGRVTLVNPGNVGGRVTVRITAGAGGLTAPSVTHVASNRTLQFAASLTIPEGNWIDVDMEAHTVLENGTASRNGWVTGRGWSFFEPGSNQWVFGAQSGVGTMAITATPSWM